MVPREQHNPDIEKSIAYCKHCVTLPDGCCYLQSKRKDSFHVYAVSEGDNENDHETASSYLYSLYLNTLTRKGYRVK